ncbi:hypothetical protein LV779_24560 [Streptomyces thinghirensis]|nr:hypothetical protein [Streptomyces thinghirensis]
MRFLERERATLAKLLPELDPRPARGPADGTGAAGQPGHPALPGQRRSRTARPRVPPGPGRRPALDALRRAAGHRQPLAVPGRGHHHAPLLHGHPCRARWPRRRLEWMLIEGGSASNRVIASGFAEGAAARASSTRR